MGPRGYDIHFPGGRAGNDLSSLRRVVPLIYISVFVPVPYCLDDCGLVVEPEVR